MEGKWQDVVQRKEFLDLGRFDVVYTDTFAENYYGEHGYKHLWFMFDQSAQNFTNSSCSCRT